MLALQDGVCGQLDPQRRAAGAADEGTTRLPAGHEDGGGVVVDAGFEVPPAVGVESGRCPSTSGNPLCEALS